MAVETVLLALLGVVATWLAFDACRERHRLRARMERAAARADRARRHPADPPAARVDAGPGHDASPSGSWRYWPLTVATTEDGSVGPRF